MNKLFASIVLIGSISLSQAACALPAQVFRVDDRNPSVIFQAGFHAWGVNTNLLEHIEGSTCNFPEATRPVVTGSTYISTSEDTQVAMNVVRVRLRQMIRAAQPAVVWMYTIRATQNVFNVARTFEASGQTLGAGRLQPAYRTAVVLREWVFRGDLPRDLIVGAQRYEMINDVPVAVANGYLANPHFVDARTEANPGTLTRAVLTDGQTTMGRLRAAITDGTRTVISACWCNTRGDGSASRAATSPTTTASTCTDQITNVWPTTPNARFVPGGHGFWPVEL